MFPKFTIPPMLTKAEERRLLATVRGQGSRRDLALLTLALGTGLRLRELRGLNVGDVRVDGDALRQPLPQIEIGENSHVEVGVGFSVERHDETGDVDEPSDVGRHELPP